MPGIAILLNEVCLPLLWIHQDVRNFTRKGFADFLQSWIAPSYGASFAHRVAELYGVTDVNSMSTSAGSHTQSQCLTLHRACINVKVDRDDRDDDGEYGDEDKQGTDAGSSGEKVNKTVVSRGCVPLTQVRPTWITLKGSRDEEEGGVSCNDVDNDNDNDNDDGDDDSASATTSLTRGVSATVNAISDDIPHFSDSAESDDNDTNEGGGGAREKHASKRARLEDTSGGRKCDDGLPPANVDSILIDPSPAEHVAVISTVSEAMCILVMCDGGSWFQGRVFASAMDTAAAGDGGGGGGRNVGAGAKLATRGGSDDVGTGSVGGGVKQILLFGRVQHGVSPEDAGIDHLTTTTLADHQLRRAEASLHPSDDSRKTSHRPTCTPPDTSPRREHTTHTRSNTVDTVKIDVTRTLHVRAPHQAAAWPASPEPHKPQRAHCGDTCDQACQATVCILLQLVTTRGSAPRTPAAPRLLLLPPTCC